MSEEAREMTLDEEIEFVAKQISFYSGRLNELIKKHNGSIQNSIKKAKNEEIPWEDFLAWEIVGNCEKPKDLYATVFWIVNKWLPKEDAKVILAKYQDNKTDKEIAETVLYCSEEETKARIEFIYEKLRHPKIAQMFVSGLPQSPNEEIGILGKTFYDRKIWKRENRAIQQTEKNINSENDAPTKKAESIRNKRKNNRPWKNKAPWRDQLAAQVTSEEFSKPADFEASVDIALSTLTIREENVLRKRYEEKMTLEECGEYFHVTRERIRQIEGKAIRKLRRPSRLRYFTVGCEQMKIDAQRQEEERIKRYQETGNTLKEKIESGHFNIPIEDLDPSIRAYNVLKRAGVDKVSDILAMMDGDEYSGESLMKIRNCGRKTVNEILDKLVLLGALQPDGGAA